MWKLFQQAWQLIPQNLTFGPPRSNNNKTIFLETALGLMSYAFSSGIVNEWDQVEFLKVQSQRTCRVLTFSTDSWPWSSTQAVRVLKNPGSIIFGSVSSQCMWGKTFVLNQVAALSICYIWKAYPNVCDTHNDVIWPLNKNKNKTKTSFCLWDMYPAWYSDSCVN